MNDRPRGDGDPEEGTPEYRWLYGGSAGAAPDPPREPRPDETRVMPTAPRRPSSPSPRRSDPPAPPRRPAAPPAAAGRPRRRRGVGSWLRILLVVVLLWVVYLVAVPLWAWQQVEKVDFEPAGDRPSDQPGTTYLLVGSDSRAGLSPEERKKLGTGNAAGQRTDTIMLLHTGSGPNLLMSIPRDSLVEIPGHGTTKINAAYAYGGPQLLVRTIEENTGIRVDSYVEIGLGGLAGVVDAVGGITICPKQAMHDKLANLDVKKKGCQEADGTTALGYARSRHTSSIGDIDRVRRQREVVAAVGHEVISPWTVLNPVRYWRLSNSVPDFFTFGEGTSPLRAAMWASAMTRVNGENGLSCVVPISDLAVHWDPERSQQMFDYIKQDKSSEIPPALCTPTGLPKGVTG